MSKRLSAKSQLIVILLAVSLGSIAVIGYLSWNQSRAALTDVVLQHLTSVRNSKAAQIERYFHNLRRDVANLAQDETVISAMVRLNTAFKELEHELIPAEWEQALEQYYENDFFTRLAPNIDSEPTLEFYKPENQAARYLQYWYIAANQHPVDEKHALDTPDDGSTYSKVHTRYHPIFRNIVDRSGYYDLFLIDFDTKDIVYSVSKEVDFATSLREGAFTNSPLDEVVEAVRARPDVGAIQMIDFKPYAPSYEAPAAFVSAPIYNGPHIVGVLAVQLPDGEINRVTTGNQNWKADGLGQRGETYLVGPDLYMRSTTRLLLEDPAGYEKTLRQANTPEKIIKAIKQFNTTILQQKVDTPAARAALAGEEGTVRGENHLGASVMSAYAPVQFGGVNWGIITEMDWREINQPIVALRRNLLVAIAIVAFVMSLLAVVFSYYFLQPVNMLLASTEKVLAGQPNVEIEIASRGEFGYLADRFKQMEEQVHTQTELVQRKSRENEALLHNLVPPIVAERMKRGDERIVYNAQQASLLVVQLVGVTQLSAARGAEETAKILDDLLTEFDDAADRLGMEQLRTSGESYMVVCGLTVLHLDHAKRSVECALEMLEALRHVNSVHDAQISLRIGIHTGSMSAGVLGNKMLMYTMWGEAVDIATHLSANARLNEILVSRPVYNSLQDIHTFVDYGAIEIEDGEQGIPTWLLAAS